MSEQVQKITHVEHILKRPDSYVGPTAKVDENYYVLDGDKFVNRKVSYAPALLKIFDEILVNAIDRHDGLNVSGSTGSSAPRMVAVPTTASSRLCGSIL